MRRMDFDEYLTSLDSHSSDAPIIAFFDLDRTLIDGYSLTALAMQQLVNGDLGVRRFCSLGLMFLRYGLGRIDYADMLAATVTDIQGMPEAELKQLSRQAFDVRLADWLYREGDALIQKHLALGHEVVMVTSATTYQAEPIAQVLRINNVLATELDIVDGKVAGGVTPCFGQGKFTAAKAFAQLANAQLKDAYFYTDSKDDLPLMLEVGHPVVVNGKPKLVKIGQDNGWVSLRFHDTGRDHFAALDQRRAA